MQTQMTHQNSSMKISHDNQMPSIGKWKYEKVKERMWKKYQEVNLKL